MARVLGPKLLYAAIVFFVLLAVLQILFPIRERFSTTLYGAKKNKPKGAFCEFNAECASDMCAHFTNAEGKHHTCL